MTLKKNQLPYLHFSLIFFSMLPVTMIVPVFKDIVKDLHGGNNFMVSVFMSIAMLGSFLFSPVAGFYSDKYKNRKKFIAVFAILDGICFIILAKSQSLIFLQFIRFLEGVCHIFVIGLLLSSISDMENDKNNSTYFKKGILLGIAGMFLSLGVGLGSPLGVLGKNNPLTPVYFASAIMFAIGIIAFFKLQDHPNHHHEIVTFKKWRNAFSSNSLIVVPYIFNFIDRFTVGFFVTSFNLHLREELAMNPGQVGLFLSAILVPMSILSYPFAKLSKYTGAFPLMLVGSFIYGLNLSIAGFLTNEKLLLLVLILSGVGAGVMFVPSMISASQMAPKGYNASIMAGFTGIGSIGFMLGPLASSFLENIFRTTFPNQNNFGILSSIFGGLEILIVIITIPFYKKIMEIK